MPGTAPKKAKSAPAKKAKSAAAKPGKPFFVRIAVLTPDDQHEIQFGVSKLINSDNSVTWTLHFVLKELKNGQMKTRVEVEAQVGPEDAAAIEKLSKTKKLDDEQVATLNGPVADLAKELPAGSKGTPEFKAAVVEAITT